jgi:hypothetical protein
LGRHWGIAATARQPAPKGLVNGGPRHPPRKCHHAGRAILRSRAWPPSIANAITTTASEARAESQYRCGRLHSCDCPGWRGRFLFDQEHGGAVPRLLPVLRSAGGRTDGCGLGPAHNHGLNVAKSGSALRGPAHLQHNPCPCAKPASYFCYHSGGSEWRMSRNVAVLGESQRRTTGHGPDR